jgi:hypothetical protein
MACAIATKGSLAPVANIQTVSLATLSGLPWILVSVIASLMLRGETLIARAWVPSIRGTTIAPAKEVTLERLAYTRTQIPAAMLGLPSTMGRAFVLLLVLK